MRYATAQHGESTQLLGKFTSGRTPAQVQMTLIDLATSAAVTLTSADCSEIVASASGGVSTYKWPTSSIQTQPTVRTEYLYVMRDTITGLTHEGKLVLGGYPDRTFEAANGLASRGRIDITTNPWRELRYVWAEGGPPDTVIHEIYELYDQDGVALSGDHTAGNNPLFDTTRLIAERRRV